LWDFGVTRKQDPGFGQTLCWDIPLLEGYPWEMVPNRSRRPGFRFWGIDNPELDGRLRVYAPDAVLCMGYNYATFARLLLRWDRKRSPLLLRGDSHRLVPRKGAREWLKRQLLTAIFRRFAAFLYVGEANRDYWRQHGVSEEKLFFSPHAVDNSRFMANTEAAHQEARVWRRELGIPEDRQVILFAGKFEEKKRPQDLLEAFARAGLPQACLLLVGAGHLEETLRRTAAGLSHVYFAPFQNQSRMPRTYAAADVLVLPSVGPSETWGLCINEAMCLGKAVIVSSHVGCARNLVVPGQTGLVFEAGQVDALADCLRQACASPDRLRAWGQAGRERVGGYCYEAASKGLCAALEGIGKYAVRSKECRARSTEFGVRSPG